MKFKNPIGALLLAFAISAGVYLQEAVRPGWTRVQTDNGEFSIELPEGFAYLFDKDGFYVSFNSEEFILSDVNIVKAYVDHTLICLEVYRAYPDALKPLIDSSGAAKSITKGVLNGVPTKTMVGSGGGVYQTTHYFKSDEHIYVLTAASRTKDSPVAKRFLESMKYTPGSKTPSPDVHRLSTLPRSPVNIKTKDFEPASVSKPPVTADPDSKPLVIISKPIASFTNSALTKNVGGTVRFRIDFGANGFTPLIEVHETLSAGLSRQALFAALRLKFLPAEKAGIPITKKSFIEYQFEIRQ